MDRSQARSVLAAVIAVLVAGLLMFIWGNSLKGPAESKELSDSAARIIKPVLEKVVGAGRADETLVRKLGHFAEFLALGSLCGAFGAVVRSRGVKGVANRLSLCLAAAVTDEAIQMFTGRGPLVSDVLLDFGAAAAAIIAVAALAAAFEKAKD